ncbi:MAG: hypothetical protein R3C19_05810 [Planctomycetaceae bacterium]
MQQLGDAPPAVTTNSGGTAVRKNQRRGLASVLAIVVVGIAVTFAVFHQRHEAEQAFIENVSTLQPGSTREQVQAVLGVPEWTGTQTGFPFGSNFIDASHPLAPTDETARNYTLCVWSAGAEKATVVFDESETARVRWLHFRRRPGYAFWRLMDRLKRLF